MKQFTTLFLAVVLSISSALAQKVIGILGAFPPELVLLKQQLVQPKDTVIRQIHFTKGLLRGRQVVVAQTGIGKVNAAIVTTLMLEHFKPQSIVFSGIAGGVDSTLQPGDIVIGTTLTYHDYGAVTDSGMVYNSTKNPATMMPNPLYFNCDTALVNKAMAVAKKVQLEKVQRGDNSFLPTIKSGIIVTGDVFVSSEKLNNQLRYQLHAAATEMEGAAVAQVCWQQQTPFLVIRSLSDNANSKASTDVKHFYAIAAKNAATLVMALLEALQQ
jgi:adenosylhomocysteine nucleosidase